MKNKKNKSGESKLRIGKDTVGNRTCVAVKPSKLSSSSNKTLCIGTKGVQSGHTHTHGDSNANQSEHQQPHTDSLHDQSENPQPQNDPPSRADSHIAHSHPPTDDGDVATDTEDMEQSSKKDLPQPRAPTAAGLVHPVSKFYIRQMLGVRKCSCYICLKKCIKNYCKVIEHRRKRNSRKLAKSFA